MSSYDENDTVEVEVTVILHGEKAVMVSEGGDEREIWVPYSLIDDDSEVHESTPVGVTALLVLPSWKAEELGLGNC